MDYNYRKEITYKEYLLKFEKVADWDENWNRIYRPITEEEADRLIKNERVKDTPRKFYLTNPIPKP